MLNIGIMTRLAWLLSMLSIFVWKCWLYKVFALWLLMVLNGSHEVKLVSFIRLMNRQPLWPCRPGTQERIQGGLFVGSVLFLFVRLAHKVCNCCNLVVSLLHIVSLIMLRCFVNTFQIFNLISVSAFPLRTYSTLVEIRCLLCKLICLLLLGLLLPLLPFLGRHVSL